MIPSQSQSQGLENMAICLEKGCLVLPKIFNYIPNIDETDYNIHFNKNCNIMKLNDIIQQLKSSQSSAYKLFADDWIDQIIKKIDNFSEDIINFLVTRIRKEVQTLKQKLYSVFAQLDEYKNVYKSVVEEDVQAFQKYVNLIPELLRPPPEKIQIQERIQAFFKILQFISKQIKTKFIDNMNKFQQAKAQVKQKANQITLKKLKWNQKNFSQLKNLNPEEVKKVNEIRINNEETPQILEVLKNLGEYDKLEKIQIKYSKFDNSTNIDDISSIEYLSGFNQIKTLSLVFDQNKIIDLSSLNSLKRLTQLKDLNLSFRWNEINDITPIKFVAELKDIETMQLQFAFNQISDINVLEQIQSLSNLKKLSIDLSVNKISDIQSIGVLRILQEIQELEILFTYNKITDIKPLQEMRENKNLKSLSIDLRFNYLKNLDQLKFLKEMVQIRKISLNFSDFPETIRQDYQKHFETNGCTLMGNMFRVKNFGFIF